MSHPERHRTEHIGWLRAAVLGANDGIISISSLIVGVASVSSGAAFSLAGAAGLVAGAMSMAAGEYVSVSSQSDTERADMARERAELLSQPDFEKRELASIYVTRGLSPELAAQVAEQLMAHDALGAHARDELGVSHTVSARPIQAAVTSAASFAAGGVLPLFVGIVSPAQLVVPLVAASSLVLLTVLGALAGLAGGAPMWKPAMRVAVLGALAMALTAGVSTVFGGAP